MNDWTRGRILSNTHWTADLFSLKIETQIQPFQAGQHTFLTLDPDTDGQPYAIASTPVPHPGIVEFFLCAQGTGDLSDQLATLGQGDTLWVRNWAEGDFTLDAVSDASVLWLLATGTGVAPFLSMLQTSDIWSRFDTVVLVYAAREDADIQYRDLFEHLSSSEDRRFVLVPVVSRENAENTVSGRIPAAIQNGEIERFAGRTFDKRNSQVMLCGNPGMIEDAAAALRDRGFIDNPQDGQQTGILRYERYW